MANNAYINRVDFGNETLIDISDTTAEAGDVIVNKTFYTRSGAPATGTLGDATATTHGLMSAEDKRFLDSVNSDNTTFTITNNDFSETVPIVNAKATNLNSCICVSEAAVSAPIRTSNLLNVEDIQANAYINGSGVITPTSAGGTDRLGPFIEVSPGQDIYYTGYTDPSAGSTKSFNRRLHVYDSNKNWIKQVSFVSVKGPNTYWSTNGTLPNNAAYVCVAWNEGDYSIQITVGAPTSYEPYYLTPFIPLTSATLYVSSDGTLANTDEYTINVPQAAGTVYGFEWNPVAGKIWITTEHITSYNNETLSNYWWSDKESYNPLISPSIGAEVVYLLDEEDWTEYDITPLDIPLNRGDNILWVNNGFVKNLNYSAETFAVNHLTIQDKIRLRNTNITEDDVIAWNNTVSELETKAPLMSPAFTGSPTGSTAGRSTNNERLATTRYVVNQLNNIAPVESSTTKATKNYSVGEYLIFNGYLYKVTTAIVSGEVLTNSTSIEETDVATELNLLFSLIT